MKTIAAFNGGLELWRIFSPGNCSGFMLIQYCAKVMQTKFGEFCSCEFSSAISREISQNFGRKVSVPNDISCEISRKYYSLF